MTLHMPQYYQGLADWLGEQIEANINEADCVDCLDTGYTLVSDGDGDEHMSKCGCRLIDNA